MTIKKSDLKAIVKECLVEILSEGIGQSSGKPLVASQPTSRPPFSENKTVLRRASPQLREAVKREAGGNKVMESILADTAASTLPKMLQNEGRPAQAIPSGIVEQVVAEAQPEELFGEDVTSRWANLAFMDPSTKK